MAQSVQRQHQPALIAALVADAVVIFLSLNNFELPHGMSLRQVGGRIAVSLVAPLGVLLLANLLPAGLKDVLVFWRVSHVLPGHRAFTAQFLDDPRIDRDKLARNMTVGMPTEPREQNTVWYRMFKKVEAEPSVDESNRMFLLLRELAAISVLLALVGLFWSAMTTRFVTEAITVSLFFAIQYSAAALGSANQAKRLVASVLAAHSWKRRI